MGISPKERRDNKADAKQGHKQQSINHAVSLAPLGAIFNLGLGLWKSKHPEPLGQQGGAKSGVLSGSRKWVRTTTAMAASGRTWSPRLVIPSPRSEERRV